MIDVVSDLKTAIYGQWSGSGYAEIIWNKLEEVSGTMQYAYTSNALGVPPGGWPKIYLKLSTEPTVCLDDLQLVKEV